MDKNYPGHEAINTMQRWNSSFTMYAVLWGCSDVKINPVMDAKFN
jgi:hypothetical protein